jgi:hypothetical protein
MATLEEVMAKKNEFRQYRDNYTLRFNDDAEGVVWTTGNLQRFLRNLWNANPILRELNPDKTARAYALRIGRTVNVALYRSAKTGKGYANFYLVPHTVLKCYRDSYSGIISRNAMKAVKVL